MTNDPRWSSKEYSLSDHVVWSLSSSGIIKSLFGPWMDARGIDAQGWIGRHVAELCGDLPEFRSLYRQLELGRSVREFLNYQGTHWFVEAYPCLIDGGLVGVSGVSFSMRAIDTNGKPASFELYEGARENSRLHLQAT